MSEPNQDIPDVHSLFEAFLDGTLSPSQAQELDALLVRDAEARRRYVEHVQLRASLAYSAQVDVCRQVSSPEASTAPALPAAPLESPHSESPHSESPGAGLPGVVTPPGLTSGGFFHSLPLMLFTLAAFGGGAAFGVYFLGHPQEEAILPMLAEDSRSRSEPEAKANTKPAKEVVVQRVEAASDMALSSPAPFATLVKVAGCKWGACTLPTQTGSRLSAGLLRLDSGKAQITFDNGARLYLQGPAVFYLYSPSRTHLRSGKLVANVPEQAIGFTIETQRAEIVDLGTEFGVNVAQSGDTEVQVLDGEVEVGAPPEPVDPQRWLLEPEAVSDAVGVLRQRLPVGEARRIGAISGQWQRVDFTPDLYRLLRPSSRITPESPWRRVLGDDFDDNFLDPDKWRVLSEGVAASASQVREIDGRIVLVSRSRLVTVNQFDPVRLEGLRITGQWTFQTPEDIFEVVLRTDASAGGSDGAAIHGVHFAAHMERTTSHIGIFGTGRALDLPPAFGDILINPGDVFNFEILDLPGGMSLRLWEASGSGAEAHVRTVPAQPCDTNYVVFYNRQRGTSPKVAYLDNVVFEQGNGNVRMNAEGLIEVKR
jgi:hypothetical protein